ncbi:hypothetical protein [Tahibacter sp.]|uniref:hypothetical protein n=1 Tax=Tahibacter sp. TaxID=2056211 RepID=UPI0028C421D0|nr:hypothetical protein [Tahibacter sp.]
MPEAASSTVCDYHVDCDTLDGLAQRGAEAPLLSALRQVVGMRQDVEFDGETA